MAKVSIEATQGVYLTYKNYTYTAPQVFGEYIDNAIQSNTEHISMLKSMNPGHKLRVDISVDWYQDPVDKVVKARSVTIQDNAAGMTADVFSHAFNLADGEISRKGMNEFGVGMKAASAWLGNKWRIESTAVDDRVTRIIEVDLTEVATKQIKELDSQETVDSTKSHGTVITISQLWPENVIKKSAEEDLVKNIASIYRYFIRNREVQIFFGEQLLTFDEYTPLKAPSYKDPNGESIVWRKEVAIDDHNGHTLSGFIGILEDGKGQTEKRGVVFTRNNRVVMGFDPNDRTVGKVFCGQVGSFKYRRVYGELEISGFSVAFGKNKLNDPELLEALCEGAAGKLKINGVSLLQQADKYRATKKTPKPPVPTPPVPEPPVIPTPQEPEPQVIPTPPTPEPPCPPAPTSPEPELPVVPTPPVVIADTFECNGKVYSCTIDESTESNEIFWNDLSLISMNQLLCKVNPNHPFFTVYGRPDSAMLSIFKALSISKFKANFTGGNIASMMNEFNAILKTLK